MDNIERQIEELYIQCFPQDEREPFGSILSRLKGESPIKSYWKYIEENGEVKGFVIGDLHILSKIMIIVYIAVKPEYRNKGIGRTLMMSFIKGMKGMGGVEYFILECEDPEQCSDEFASHRVRIYKKWGFYRIPIHHIMPPLDNGLPVLENLLLIKYGGEPIKSLSLALFYLDFYKELGYLDDIKHLERIYENITEVDDDGFITVKEL